MACLFPKQDMCQPEMAGVPWSVLPCGVDAVQLFSFRKIFEGEWLCICFSAEVKVATLGCNVTVWQAV